MEVAKRGRRRSITTVTATAAATNRTKDTAARVTRTPRVRPVALSVKMDGEEFPALLKTVRQKVDPGVTGDSIAKLRRTMAGDLLIEINGGTSAAEVMRAEVQRSLGPAARVRKLEEKAPVEIRDIDTEATKEEVLEAVASLDQDARLVSLRLAYGGAQTAVVALSSTAARRLCSVGRLRVGLVFARVRSVELPDRCYKCLAFGHTRRNCGGIERGDCCWRCGGEGHKARDCGADSEAAAAFQAVLADSARQHKTVVESRRVGVHPRIAHDRAEQDGATNEDRGATMEVCDG